MLPIIRARIHHERVDDALDQGHRHHVAVLDVREFVRQHAFDLVVAHGCAAARGHRDQALALARTGGKRVDLGRLVVAHFRHRQLRLLRQPRTVCTASPARRCPVWPFDELGRPATILAIARDISSEISAPPMPQTRQNTISADNRCPRPGRYSRSRRAG